MRVSTTAAFRLTVSLPRRLLRRRIIRMRRCPMFQGRLHWMEGNMARKLMMALFALAAIGLVQPTAALARGGGGGGMGGHRGMGGRGRGGHGVMGGGGMGGHGGWGGGGGMSGHVGMGGGGGGFRSAGIHGGFGGGPHGFHG